MRDTGGPGYRERVGKPATTLGAGDFVPPIALVALGVADLALSGRVDFPGHPAVSAVLLVAVSLPLVWRRSAPVTALAVIAAVAFGWIYGLYYEHDRQPPIEAGLALMFAMYSAAAYSAGRQLPVAAGFSVAVILADIPRLVAGAAANETVPAWLFYALAWAVGLGMRRRIESESGLRERAVGLERERDERAREAALAERDRIARDLHDVIAHRISTIVMQASIEGRMLGDGATPVRKALASIEQSGREAMVELRRLLGVLRGPDDAAELRPEPSLRELDELFERIRAATGVRVELRIEGSQRALPAGVELSAFRIVQEALTNITKHAGAANAQVVLRYREGQLDVEVLDNGPGRWADGDRGFGLIGMRERAALHGGSLEAGPGDGGGFAVRATLPIGEASR